MSIRVAWVVPLAAVFSTAAPAAEKAVQDDGKISCEVRFVCVHDAFIERTGIDFQGLGDGGATLSHEQLRKFVAAAQVDPETHIIQTVSFNGQEQSMSCAELTLTARPTVEEDGRTVHVDLQTHWGENGPRRNKSLSIPAGFTAVVVTGQHYSFESSEYGPPILSRIPYINRLFKNVGYGRERMTLLVLLTPRFLANESRQRLAPVGREEMSEPAAKGKNAQLEKLLSEYEKACEAGHRVKAYKIAEEALKLDPACFSRHRRTTERIHGGIE